MNVLLIAVGIIVIILALQFYFKSRLQKQTGKVIPTADLPEDIKKLLSKEKSLIYFFSPTCHNCKHQTPIVENLKKRIKNIYSFDISKDLKTAREFGIMATPTILIMNKNVVKHILLGIVKEDKLLEKFES